MARIAFGVALACLLALAAVACTNPAPLDPSSAEFGKKPCSTNEDCASHFCGPDHRCG
jgi:hypothetical protein